MMGKKKEVEVEVRKLTLSHVGLCDLIDCSLLGSCPWNFPDKNTGVGCHFLLQVTGEPVYKQSDPTVFVLP